MGRGGTHLDALSLGSGRWRSPAIPLRKLHALITPTYPFPHTLTAPPPPPTHSPAPVMLKKVVDGRGQGCLAPHRVAPAWGPHRGDRDDARRRGWLGLGLQGGFLALLGLLLALPQTCTALKRAAAAPWWPRGPLPPSPNLPRAAGGTPSHLSLLFLGPDPEPHHRGTQESVAAVASGGRPPVCMAGGEH